MKLSLAMIVKNEEEKLARCLDSVRQYVDEIVITDTGSTDRTKEIAAAYGQRFMILNGAMTFQKREIFVLNMPPGISY